MLSERKAIVETLQERVRQLETGRQTDCRYVSSGSKAIDSLLPSQGFRRGTLIEWLSSEGGGAGTLALIAAKEACREGSALVVVDYERTFYPPAAAGLGIDLANTIVVCPRNRRDHSWALHQALSCSGVAVVLCWLDQLDSRMFRRLQLAAEKGGGLGLFVRPETVRGSPSWSDVQLLVQALPGAKSSRRLRVELMRCRGGNPGKSVELEIDDETGAIRETDSVHLASELAHSTNSHRSSRA